MNNISDALTKLETGIEGFDYVSLGGLPRGRTTLVAGTSGSAKTIFAIQFLADGIAKYGESGVFVTFEESPEDIRRNMKSLGWDIALWEAEGKWAFVDVSPLPDEESVFVGEYDLGALMARIEHAVNKVQATRLSLDSLGAIFSQFTDIAIVRRELFRIGMKLKKLGLTALLTAERIHEYGEIARFGVEEFVSDNVIILRNNLDETKRRRTLEILKFRGTSHQKGEYPFTVVANVGFVVIPLSAMEMSQKSSNVRIYSGNATLDEMCGGGFFRDSITLLSGATGCGKTLLSTEFMMGGIDNGERSLLFAYEESRDQLFRNAAGWGRDFNQLEKDGLLKVICTYPETATLEDHLIGMKILLDEFKPNRVSVDSLASLSRISSLKGFREFVIGLTSFLKERQIAGFFTTPTINLLGGESVTDAHISNISDAIILMSYVEMSGSMHRGLTFLKMRGSMHDKDIREFTIDEAGLHIGKSFSDITGILSGRSQYVSKTEVKQRDGLLGDPQALKIE